jgi:hypothetical protein
MFKIPDTDEVNTLDKKVIKSRNELMKIFKTANNYFRFRKLKSREKRFAEFSNILFFNLISKMEDIEDEIHALLIENLGGIISGKKEAESFLAM